jgi:hypothetical protein
MVSGEFKEKEQTEVELPEKSCQDVSEMIRFIHPGFGDDLEGGVDSAFRLLPIFVVKPIKTINMKSNVCNSLNCSAQYIGRHD